MEEFTAPPDAQMSLRPLPQATLYTAGDPRPMRHAIRAHHLGVKC
jgi:hypothetical protein